jgi:hypothetical protein
MQDHGDDAALLRRQRTFLEQIERSIRAVNRETIHETIPELDRDSFVRMALRVARLRAGYLQVALAAEGESDGETAAWARRLREHREAFEEARDAFDALQRAIERGYVDVGLHAG